MIIESQVKINEKSKSIVENKLRFKLAMIFKSLDSSNTGLISANRINLESIQPKVLRTLKPLLMEMESYDETLDEEEFVESALVLLEVSKIKITNYLCRTSHLKKNLTF